MQPHQDRVLVERNDLADKAEKLRVFLDGRTFEALPYAEKTLLAKQHFIMRDYLEVLDKRIARFPIDPAPKDAGQ